MGGRLSRRVEVFSPEVNSNHPYTYPPREGQQYFSNHYHLGSRKFETGDPEHFLFSDLSDVNYMTSPPGAFPYKQPARKKPVECLSSFLNLHKESVKLVRPEGDSSQYTIEFLFDSDVPCQISIFFSLLDVSTMEGLRHGQTTSAVTKVSQSYVYDKGLEQNFSQLSFVFNPSRWMEEKLTYNPEEGQNLFPVSILLETQSTSDSDYQSLLTLCKLDRSASNPDSFTIKVLKQKVLIDSMEYLLHDIFGLENKAVPKNAEDEDSDDDDSDDDDIEFGAECVICYTDVRDTILLPCRHFCICSSCAGDLRYQASNCPICRSPFQALLQIQALQELPPDNKPDDDEITDNPELYSVPGYMTVSLMQAVNGYPRIKRNKDHSTATDVPLSTGDEDEEEEDDMNTREGASLPIGLTDTVIILEENGISLDTHSPTGEKGVEAMPKEETGNDEEGEVEGTFETVIEMNGETKGLRITASIEDDSNPNTPDQSLKRNSSNSTSRSGGSSSQNSMDSFSSHDVLISPDK
ncbi:PREDICTED: E3 ubiquitin-protein ligase MGRN1-like [Amphimedon queenslandica]|uniref:RING-type E3 ubiquitin transferase n=1 Tax=Amphimedon queenslandica TaxID=400682 RepID=A0A1X7VDW7_AMPQE|nr:PREDICTED: E3 ubiquitin-protein ligase MGRN1-like [Amphimedon queenslandica]|eukprot:XP_019849223.1 PREDICTED: E3 ubiquitin-protein ligase MGRN1-like [Amphimedon queenslandica]